MFCSFAQAASSIPCGNRQVREENSKLLLTSLETLTPQHETWKIQEKDLLLNRAGNCLNITCLIMNCIICEISITINTL